MDTQQFSTRVERVDDIPLLLAQMRKLHLPELLDEHFRAHGNWQGLSIGQVTCGWLSYKTFIAPGCCLNYCPVSGVHYNKFKILPLKVYAHSERKNPERKMENKQTTKIAAGGEFEQGLVDSIELPESTLNLLFAALFLTAIGTFLAGNLLLLDAVVLQHSGQVMLACLGILLILYTLSRSFDSVIWGLALTYALMWVVVYSRQPWLIAVMYAFAAFGFLYTARFLRVERRQLNSLLLMAAIGTITALAAPSFTSLDMIDRLHAGSVHQDTLFHASIAAMIKNYGIVSTGLHGLVEWSYHILSHVLVANLSLLSGIAVIEVYGVAMLVLFIPILIYSVVACRAMLDGARQSNIALPWGLVCMLLLILPLFFKDWALWDYYFVSESYLVSLGLFLLGFPLLFKARLTASDFLLVLLLTTLLLKAKISVGFVYAGLWLTGLIFIRGKRTGLALIAVLSAVIVTALVVFNLTGGRIPLTPLRFIRDYSYMGHWIGIAMDERSLYAVILMIWSLSTFLAFHFLLSWTIIGYLVYTKGKMALLTEPIGVYSLAAVTAGSMIALFFNSERHGYYFTNVAFFIALPGVVALLAHWIGHLRVKNTRLLVFGALSASFLLVSWLRPHYPEGANFWLGRPLSQQQHPFIASLLRVRDWVPVDTAMKLDPAAKINHPVDGCVPRPLVFPAVSERPWIDVIAVRNDCVYSYFGYGRYGINRSQQRVTVQPRLLPGMTIRNYPASTPNDVDSKDRTVEE
uniref:Uncharacterized protein n=1 Tax=Candidatus Kentrum sp. FM TaxID=2126340 RepID=A0A450SRH8_9GAMM|nr:MAG: hypothetical protein BECKFM1743C_GA0114222_101821 [Candidatus Kentron sp. FM]VFJ58039.1 MAG: hypothetical protein BECKFM1743A_GA0114220_102071 [Candidatus Kentron sp. FM]VFK11594.1 MAG: hypothetical protein BECKFM1743B_GA0114221_101961 [Candidatus Kentron sp. FM]